MTKQERLKEMKAGADYYRHIEALLDNMIYIINSNELDENWPKQAQPWLDETRERKAKLEAIIKELEND